MVADKKIIIIQHEDSTPPGYVLDWLKNNNKNYLLIHMKNNFKNFPHLNEVGGVIVLGGEMNVDQEASYPWLATEKQWLAQVIKAESVGILGICLGGQLLAESLGAVVKNLNFFEVGWTRMSSNHELNGLTKNQYLNNAPEYFFSWHGYGFEMPKDAQPLFKSENWGNQGFVYKQKIVGLQFHPEADDQFVQECSDLAKNKQWLPTDFVQDSALMISDPSQIEKSHLWLKGVLRELF